MTKQTYYEELEKLRFEMTNSIHRIHNENRANSPETTIACRDIWREYKRKIRALRKKFGLPVENVKHG